MTHTLSAGHLKLGAPDRARMTRAHPLAVLAVTAAIGPFAGATEPPVPMPPIAPLPGDPALPTPPWFPPDPPAPDGPGPAASRVPGNALANGGFEACAPRDQALLAYGPRGLAGRSACPPWVTRPGVRGSLGELPWSRSGGDLLGSENRYGVLRIAYDARDAVLLLEERLGAAGANALADPGRVRIEARAAPFAIVGARVETAGGLVPADGSPVLLTPEWRTIELAFPAGVGAVVAFAMEIDHGTPHGAIVEIDDVRLLGARAAPRIG